MHRADRDEGAVKSVWYIHELLSNMESTMVFSKDTGATGMLQSYGH